MPVVPNIDETAAAIMPIPVMEKIRAVLAAAEDVMRKARGEGGIVRNAKLLLTAAENLRRGLDTAVKLQEMIMDGMEVDRFHAVCMEEIARCDPATAQRIVRRLQDVNSAWSAKR